MKNKYNSEEQMKKILIVDDDKDLLATLKALFKKSGFDIYGNMVGWQLLEGRDFSRDYSTNSAGIVLNLAPVDELTVILFR